MKPNAWLISIWLCMQKAFYLSSVGQYLGFAGSNPSTRRKIENGSMEIRKKLGAKKAEKNFNGYPSPC